MRYLVLSDIHSNLEAFEQCLRVADGRYDEIVCLGDLVGYGPDPNPVIDNLGALTSKIIRGNHDKACCGLSDAEDFNPVAKIATFWTRQDLTPAHTDYLRALPAGPVPIDGFQMVHGSAADEDEYIVGPGQALPALKTLATPITLFGHTHHQGAFMLSPTRGFQSIRGSNPKDGCILEIPIEEDARYLINPGSVGQPRDGDWRAAFAIFDEGEQRVEFYRTAYDLSSTQTKMKEAGLPEPLIARLEVGR
ncbi:MAG: metallophosphoesterase family protein [Terriglobia bacterium]